MDLLEAYRHQHPRDLLNAFAQHVLRIRSDAHTLHKVSTCQVPSNTVYLRYEHDLDKLYIARSFFTVLLKQPDLVQELRRYVTFVGQAHMRIDRGVPNPDSRREVCYVLDLSKPQLLKERPRAILKTKYIAHDESSELLKIKRTLDDREWVQNVEVLMKALPDRVYHMAAARILRDHARIIDRVRRINIETINMIERRKVQARYSSLKKAEPPRVRVRMPELDDLIRLYAPGFIKRIDAHRMLDGVMVHKKSEVLPFPIRDKYDAMKVSGLYEETSRSDGSGYRKTLWLALFVVRNAVKEGKLPKNYVDDPRVVVKENKYLGKTTVRCLKIDLMR